MKKKVVLLAYTLLIIVVIGISIIPDMYRLRITPPGTTFPLIHNHPPDYFGYLGYMHMGYEGFWRVTNRVTSEHFPTQFVFTFFALLGHVSRITGVSLPVMYFIARIFSAILLLISVIILTEKMIKGTFYKLAAVILVFFSTGFWTFSVSEGQFTVNQFLTFWTRFDPILRTTFLPHHTFSSALGIFSLIYLSDSCIQKSTKKAFLAGFLAFFAGFIYHGTLTNIVGGLAIAVVFLSTRRKVQSVVGIALPLCIYLFFSLLSLGYIVYLTHTTWPLTISSNLATQFTFSVTWNDYLLALGPTVLLAFLGLPRIITHAGSLLPFFLIGWVMFPFLGVTLLVHIFPKWSIMPYLEGTSYIPLGILSVYGLMAIEKFFGKNRKVLSGLLFFLCLYFIPALYSSVRLEMSRLSPNYYNKFIPNEILEGFDYLNINTPYQSNVLSGGFMGAIIPAYSHNYIVYGDEINTFNAPEKHADMIVFFSQSDREKSMEILRKYNVSHVFFSYDTDPPNEAFLKTLPLQKVFEKGRVVIYRISQLI